MGGCNLTLVAPCNDAWLHEAIALLAAADGSSGLNKGWVYIPKLPARKRGGPVCIKK